MLRRTLLSSEQRTQPSNVIVITATTALFCLSHRELCRQKRHRGYTLAFLGTVEEAIGCPNKKQLRRCAECGGILLPRSSSRRCRHRAYLSNAYRFGEHRRRAERRQHRRRSPSSWHCRQSEDPEVADEQHPAEARRNRSRTKTVSEYFGSRVGATREHIAALATALPDLPNQFEQAVGLLRQRFQHGGLSWSRPGFCGFGLRHRVAVSQGDAEDPPAPRRASNGGCERPPGLVAARFAFAFGLVVAFAIGSFGPFLAFDWPPLLRQMLLGYSSPS